MPSRSCSNKNILRLFCIVCVIALVSPLYFGCGGSSSVNAPDNIAGNSSDYEEKTKTSRSHQRGGKPVMAPVDILYTVENPLEIEEITQETGEGEGAQLNHVVISISGLKDKEVEKKINDRIWEAYETLKSKNLPPFRGIKTFIPENALPVGDNIYSYAAANYNNILSVCLNRDIFYALPNEEGKHIRDVEGYYRDSEYVYVMEGLTFDLNTGNEIRLADVFADNVDYLALLNDLVVKELNASSAQDEGYFTRWNGMKLTESFKGLSSEQKFFLDSYGLNLIIDYDTPQFYLADFMAKTIDIPYGDLNRSVAITERFYDEGENIFTSEDAPARALMHSGYSAIPIQKQEYVDGKVSVYNYAQVSPHFPDGLMEKVLELSTVPQGKIDEMNRNTKDEKDNWNEDVRGYFEQRVNAASIGYYATITKHIGGATRETAFFSLEYHTFDRNSGRELTLDDMFVPGFDYMALVRKGFEKAIADRGGLYQDGVKLSTDESRERLNEIVSVNLGFCPNSDSIWMVAGDVEFPGGYREPLHINLTFDEIGYENLTVFEEH